MRPITPKITLSKEKEKKIARTRRKKDDGKIREKSCNVNFPLLVFMYALTLQKRLLDERSLFDENNFKTPASDKYISFIDGPFVIIEYVPYGDLLGYLRRSRGATDCYYDDPEIEPTTNVTSQQMLKYAWQISDAMRYIASKKVLLTVLFIGH